ncbi:hypothetical protein BDF22DRAFT_774528 [Syncephalis plumigaleata]|nr:hypothetical protein BDF22DRAFT_774528 [Syncephalis plumigaleata]
MDSRIIIDDSEIMLAERRSISTGISSKIPILTIVTDNNIGKIQRVIVESNNGSLGILDNSNHLDIGTSPSFSDQSTGVSEAFDLSDIEQAKTPSSPEDPLEIDDIPSKLANNNKADDNDDNEEEEALEMRSSKDRPGTPVPLKLALSMDVLLHSPLWDSRFSYRKESPKSVQYAGLRRVPSLPALTSPVDAAFTNDALVDTGNARDSIRHRRASLELDSSGVVLAKKVNKSIRDSITLYDPTSSVNPSTSDSMAEEGSRHVRISIHEPSPPPVYSALSTYPLVETTTKTENNPMSVRPPRPTLDEIFADPILYHGFETYLIDHLAEENLFFLRSVRQLRAAANNQDADIMNLRQELNRILNEYIYANSPMELNITSRCRQRIMDILQNQKDHGHNIYEILLDAEQEIEFLIQERADMFFRELDDAILNQKLQRQLSTNQRHVVIVGGGFAGFSCAEILDRMPRFHVTLIDPKAYIEYTSGVAPYSRNIRQLSRLQISHRAYIRNGVVIRDRVDSVYANYVRVSDKQIPFHYLVLATGSMYHNSLKATQVTKSNRVKCLEEEQRQVQRSNSILVIGAGPVGCEIACEIASTFPDKKITLVGSSARVLPNWGLPVSAAMKARLGSLNVIVHLNERVKPIQGQNGTTTGFLPKTWLDEQHRIMTRPTLQIQQNDVIFAAGDIANTTTRKNAFAAMCAGLCVARNICRMEKNSSPVVFGSSGTISPDTIREETHLYAGGKLAREAKESLEHAFLAHIQGTYIPALRYGRRPRILGNETSSEKKKSSSSNAVRGTSTDEATTTLEDEVIIASNNANKIGETIQDVQASKTPIATMNEMQGITLAHVIYVPTPTRDHVLSGEKKLLKNILHKEDYDFDSRRGTPISLVHGVDSSSNTSSRVSSPAISSVSSDNSATGSATSLVASSEQDRKQYKQLKGILKNSLFSKSSFIGQSDKHKDKQAQS